MAHPGVLMVGEPKMSNLLDLEGNPLVAHKEHLDRDSKSNPPTKASFWVIVARFLSRRVSKGQNVNASRSVESQKSQSVSIPRVAQSKTRQEYRKSVADLEKPMDGVGLATGNGDGDMSGVFIKDFAYPLEESPLSRSSVCEEHDEE